jgi:hypothetical protein
MKLYDVQKDSQGFIAEGGQDKPEDFFAKERSGQTEMKKKFESWNI